MGAVVRAASKITLSQCAIVNLIYKPYRWLFKNFTPTHDCDTYTVPAVCIMLCLEWFKQQAAVIMFSALVDSSNSSRTCFFW